MISDSVHFEVPLCFFVVNSKIHKINDFLLSQFNCGVKYVQLN